jgi:hypothetical protein
MIAHAKDDFDIPIHHSESLFTSLLSPHLPPLPYSFEQLHLSSPSTKMHKEQFEAYAARRTLRDELVRTAVDIPHFASVSAFERPLVDGTRLQEGSVSVTTGQKIFFASLENGGHNRLTTSEGLVDFVAETFGFESQ